MAETQAEKNKRIEASLKKRGVAFNTGAQVKARTAKVAAKTVAEPKKAATASKPAKRTSMPIIDAQIRKAGG